MDNATPNMSDLFAQLGLANDEASQQRFIDRFGGLDNRTHIAAAPFWSPAQASFIEEALQDDAEWAELIDQLNAQLR